jgi:uncharacterized protein (TIGR03118 family)
MRSYVPALALIACSACSNAPPDVGEEQAAVTAAFVPTVGHLTEVDLVSDLPGAAHQDPQLVNAWGLAFNPAGPAWVSANGTGLAQVYRPDGTLVLSVTVPPPNGGTPPSTPTGQVFNPNHGDFFGDVFIIATEDGTVSGWQPGLGAQLRVDHGGEGPVYKGVTIGHDAHGNARLYVTNFHDNKIEVYDNHYMPLHHFRFTDHDLPPLYAPFNIIPNGCQLIVTYAKQLLPDKHDDDKGPGRGFVDEFDADGHLLRRIASRGVLNAPWGLALVPDHFAHLGGKLLVGNFGDGRVHAYDLEPCPHLLGTIDDADHHPLAIDGLWALGFGPDGKLYFTAGPDDESHGLFGRLDP